MIRLSVVAWSSLSAAYLFTTLCVGTVSAIATNKIPTTTTSTTTTPRIVTVDNDTNSNRNNILSSASSIQSATSTEELLEVAQLLWLPTDENLPTHLQTQLVHHEKRQRWASQLISKLSETLTSTGATPISSMDSSNNVEEICLGSDSRFSRAINAVGLSPSMSLLTMDRPDKEARYIRDALQGLHAIFARQRHQQETSPSLGSTTISMDTLSSLCTLLERADQLGLIPTLPLKDICEIRWAARGIHTNLVRQFEEEISEDVEMVVEEEKVDNRNVEIVRRRFEELRFENLNQRVENLPFDVIPCGIDWDYILSLYHQDNMVVNDNNDADNVQRMNGEHFSHQRDAIVSILRESIPFNFDTIITRTGSAVQERRGTAWLVAPDSGIGALAYSGKLMEPQELPEIVSLVMRAVEATLLMMDDSNNIISSFDNGVHMDFFDCALCNRYPDGDSACKFHTDPEHGTYWDRTTVVVAAGASRKFAFRPIPQITTWREWESNPGGGTDDDGNLAAVTRLFPGDLVVMKDECNDKFYHAVHAATPGDDSYHSERISLVLKRALDRGSNRRGHGLAGQGRRSRRKITGTVNTESRQTSKTTPKTPVKTTERTNPTKPGVAKSGTKKGTSDSKSNSKQSFKVKNRKNTRS